MSDLDKCEKSKEHADQIHVQFWQRTIAAINDACTRVGNDGRLVRRPCADR